jgi:hypothetical protein
MNKLSANFIGYVEIQGEYEIEHSAFHNEDWIWIIKRPDQSQEMWRVKLKDAKAFPIILTKVDP